MIWLIRFEHSAVRIVVDLFAIHALKGIASTLGKVAVYFFFTQCRVGRAAWPLVKNVSGRAIKLHCKSTFFKRITRFCGSLSKSRGDRCQGRSGDNKRFGKHYEYFAKRNIKGLVNY